MKDNENGMNGQETGYDQEDDCADPSKGISGVPGRLGRAVYVCGADDSEGNGGHESKANKVPVRGDPGDRVSHNASAEHLTTGQK